MVTSSVAGPNVFESEEWDTFIVRRETDRIWFGFGDQRNWSIFCFLFAFVFILISVGIFFEGEGLRANLSDTTTCLAGIGALSVALLVALVGVHLLRSTNLIGMLDLETRCFSAINRRDSTIGKAFSCEDIYIHLAEIIIDDSQTMFHGKITLICSHHSDGMAASPKLHLTMFHYLCFEDIFRVVNELQKAASWKGIIGDEMLVNLYHSGQSSQ